MEPKNKTVLKNTGTVIPPMKEYRDAALQMGSPRGLPAFRACCLFAAPMKESLGYVRFVTHKPGLFLLNKCANRTF